ncbi:NAD(P)/FAD-dependent oxidoreductase [Nocardioides marmoribigeumensis]|uniref:Phytoene dehydrogenase-like protein n=1 Tax=Nocardioides marmoribigeumensis TaxID=433649 RepID=A0ABU2BZ74_9ACTN|nr:NAD(P)/FAD-dependent oxidoreductase [Nocardioides marmoribigeumensis]MDR7363706.1 phytoene dehydrogenase-like protein [Nocardioides marmoribigeumensis]
MTEEHEVVVVGAGLAGLVCAREIAGAGRDVLVLEASDGVGGRIRTDRVDGFLVDRGFQVLNTGYPALTDNLDLDALDLCRLDDAVDVRRGGTMHTVTNPLAQPAGLPGLVSTDLLPLGQKLRLGAYVAQCAALPVPRLLARDDVPAREAWRQAGLTTRTLDVVLKPFFAGLALEPELKTSRRFVDLMIRMFARGRSTVPARGMQAMPEQVAAALPADAVRLSCKVDAADATGVRTPGGRINARAVVVATDHWTAHELVPDLGPVRGAGGVTTWWHRTPVWEGQRGRLVTDADGSPVANTVVMSAAAPSYAPPGAGLVATSVIHRRGQKLPDDRRVRELATQLHGQPDEGWELVARHDVPRALPLMMPPHDFRRPVRVGTVFVCGDHRDTSSIQGTLVSGRRTAAAVLTRLR